MTDLSQYFVSFVCGEDGIEVRGALIRLAPRMVAFEVFQPEATVRVSQVLNPLRIQYGTECIYSGRAVIASVVGTDKGTTCEAQLADPLVDVGDFNSVDAAPALHQAIASFLGGWQKQYRIADSFKVVIADMESFLDHLRIWLGRIELKLHCQPADKQAELEAKFWQELGPAITDGIRSLFDRFEASAREVVSEDLPACWAFGRRLIHPLLLTSPFVHRTFTKPLGYAGDYEMVNMMLRNPIQGPSLFAKAVNLYALNLPPIIAHRNRLDILRTRFHEEVVRQARTGGRLEVLNIGCGPAQEILRFLAHDELSDRVAFSLVDFNDQTIKDTQREIEQVRARHKRKTTFEFTKQSVQQILKQAARRAGGPPRRTFDLIYCAGLFDYLPDPVCSGLMNHFFEQLRPGGVVLSTNVDDHPSRLEMECFLEWHLIYRNHPQMWKLRPDAASPEDCRLYRDATGVNLFLEARKPTRV